MGIMKFTYPVTSVEALFLGIRRCAFGIGLGTRLSKLSEWGNELLRTWAAGGFKGFFMFQ
jgi:hypothetical protein